MASPNLPEPASALELERCLGIWTILASNSDDWRVRSHALIELSRGSARELVTQLRYRQAGLFGERSRTLRARDQELRAGEFMRRSTGLLRRDGFRWSIPLIDADYRWAVIWSARTSFGGGPALDIYTRAPSIEQRVLDEILAQIGAHPYLGAREGGQRRCAGLFAIAQDWVPPKPYRLRVG